MGKKISNLVFFSLFIVFFLFQCSNLKNPYLDSSGSKAVLKKLSVWEGDTVEIFSHDSFAVEVYLREHLSHYSLRIGANRYWKDTLIDVSNFNKTQTRYPISFYDTGWHDIILTSHRLNGDSISEGIQIYAKSPLGQKPLEINDGDTVTFSTTPLTDDVIYIWDLHNNSVIKDYKSTTKYYFEKAPSSSIGELYATDKNDNRSPKTYFTIKSTKIQPLEISSANDSIVNDTIYTASPIFQFIGKISGASSIKNISINSTSIDSIKKTEGIFLFYKLFQSIDSLSPLKIVIDVTDDLNITVLDTMVIKYTKSDISKKPSITIQIPSDSSISSNKTISVYGKITNATAYPSGAVIFIVNSNIQKGYSPLNRETFIRNINLDIGWNSILCKFYEDTLFQGNSLAEKIFYVKCDPAAIDTLPPRIISIYNNQFPLTDSIIFRDSLIFVEAIVTDNSPIQSVLINGTAAITDDNVFFTAAINLHHLDNSIVIKATDIFNQSVSDTFHSVKFNRKPVISVDFSESIFSADSITKWKIKISDPDNDSITAVALINDSITIEMASDSTFSWRPTIKDTGWATIIIQAYDKCENTDTLSKINVSSLKNTDIAVKWLTNEKNVPDTLYAGDSLKCILRANPLSNLLPFHYKIEIVDLNTVIHDSNDSIFSWVPTIIDIGKHKIKFTITDNKTYSDSFTDNIFITREIAGIRFELPSSTDSEFIAHSPIKVVLSNVIKSPVTVNYYIDWQQSTAQNSDISSSTSGSLTFYPGETVKNINLGIVNDNLNEYDETVAIRLSNPSNNAYLETQSTFTYTILDDDYVTYSFSNSQGNGNESVRSCSASVFLSKPCISFVTLQCKVDTLYSTANSSDYTFSTQTINFTPGQTTAMVRFQIKENAQNGFNKVIAFRLSALSPQNVRQGNIVYYKYNIDGRWPSTQVNLDNNKFTLDEKATDLTIQLSTNTESLVPISVYFEIDHSLSTADSGSDYIILDKSPITFEPRTKTKSFIVRILDDSITEPDEKIVINFIKTSQGAILIQDSQQSVININKN